MKLLRARSKPLTPSGNAGAWYLRAVLGRSQINLSTRSISTNEYTKGGISVSFGGRAAFSLSLVHHGLSPQRRPSCTRASPSTAVALCPRARAQLRIRSRQFTFSYTIQTERDASKTELSYRNSLRRVSSHLTHEYVQRRRRTRFDHQPATTPKFRQRALAIVGYVEPTRRAARCLQED